VHVDSQKIGGRAEGNVKRICHLLELLRFAGVIAGFAFALQFGQTPQAQLHILMPWIVISIAGLTGIESVFFGRAASEVSGYAPSAYQRQSGLNNLALAIVAAITFILGWGTHAEVAVLSALLIFLFLSACNHAWSAIREGNLNRRNLMRPAMTVVIIAVILPFILRALAATGKEPR
jgi:hypothetical protein